MYLTNIVKAAARSSRERLQGMLDCFVGGWRNASKCKRAVKRVPTRLTRLKNGRANMVKQLRRNVVQFIRNGDVVSAFLSVDQIVEDENMIRVHDELDRFCQVIMANFPYIRHHRDCTNEVREAASTLAFASTRCRDLPELCIVRELFSERYGEEFEKAAVEGLQGSLVNLRVKEMLTSMTLPVVADYDVMCSRVSEIVGGDWRLVVANGVMEAKLMKRKGNGKKTGIKGNASSKVVDVTCGRSYRFQDPSSKRFKGRDSNNDVVVPLDKNSAINRSSKQSDTMCPNDNEVVCTGSKKGKARKLARKDDSVGGRNGTTKQSISRGSSMPQIGCCRSDYDLETVKRTISLPAQLPSYVHPNLPDCDVLEEKFKALKKEHRKQNNGKQTHRDRRRNGTTTKVSISRAPSKPQQGCWCSDRDLEIAKRTISLPAQSPSHVHPYLPDWDNLEANFKDLRKEHRKRSNGKHV